MVKTFIRVIVMLVIVGVLFWLFAPRIFNNAANTALNAVDPSIAQAQGLAQFVPAGATSQGKTGDLQINLSGLIPKTSYDITLDQGQCGTTNKDLGPVTSDGNGNFYIELPLNTIDTNKTWFVDIHQDSANGLSIACGQLQTNQDANAQAIDASQSAPDIFGGSQSLPNDPNQQGTTPPGGLPNTGVNPGNGQQYGNAKYPRKY